MEFFIPGLILVAVMAYLSTRIKKSAADAFNAEAIETDEYSIKKPEGFLHVAGDRNHEFMAYSKEFGDDDNARIRRATIEVDLLPETDIAALRAGLGNASVSSEFRQGEIIETEERANETDFHAVYKLIARRGAVYRLRFAVLAEHFEEFSSRIDDTLESFVTKQA